MPIYEYRRPDGSTFEILQSIHDETLTEDPETGVPVERVFHPVAVHFKGNRKDFMAEWAERHLGIETPDDPRDKLAA